MYLFICLLNWQNYALHNVLMFLSVLVNNYLSIVSSASICACVISAVDDCISVNILFYCILSCI